REKVVDTWARPSAAPGMTKKTRSVLLIFFAVGVEGFADPVEQILAAGGGRIFGRPAGAFAGFQAGEIGLEDRVEEKGQRIAVLARGIDHPVERRAEDAVGPAFHHIADVENKTVGDI